MIKIISFLSFPSMKDLTGRSIFLVLLLIATTEMWQVPVLGEHGISTQVVAATPADWIELISLHKQIDKV